MSIFKGHLGFSVNYVICSFSIESFLFLICRSSSYFLDIKSLSVILIVEIFSLHLGLSCKNLQNKMLTSFPPHLKKKKKKAILGVWHVFSFNVKFTIFLYGLVLVYDLWDLPYPDVMKILSIHFKAHVCLQFDFSYLGL